MVFSRSIHGVGDDSFSCSAAYFFINRPPFMQYSVADTDALADRC